MKIVICSSIEFTSKIEEIRDLLTKIGHDTEIPYYSKKIIDGEASLEEFTRIKAERGDISFRRQADEDLIIRYYNLIKESDAILVVNIHKKGIDNYIGGNTFLEMGFAHVLGKKIFLLNDIPEMNYKDEIMAMEPIILNSDLSKIQ